MTARDDLPQRARQRADAEARPAPLGRLARLCRSGLAEERLAGLLVMHRQALKGVTSGEYLPLARKLVQDPDDHCRWQALLVIAEFAEEAPEAVWEIVLKQGSAANAEQRSAVATALLERLLEHHYDAYIDRMKSEIEQGNRNLTDTLRRCWMFGGAKRHSREVDRLLRSASR